MLLNHSNECFFYKKCVFSVMATLLQENGIKEIGKSGLMVAGHQITVTEKESCENGAKSDTSPVKTEDHSELEPEIDIVINNVVCSFSVRCHLNLRQIALNGVNVEFRRENGMVTMKLRRPYTTASIWSSGRITCTGATSEDMARVAARRYARALQKLGFHVRFHNFRVVNVLGTTCMPFAIRITAFSERHKEADYEPELHPGVTYKLVDPKATLKIFSTGSVTITARSVSDVQSAVERIYPLLYEFRKTRTAAEEEVLRARRASKLPPLPASPTPSTPPGSPERLLTVSDDEDDWD